jgi:hypothetical protein
MEETKISKGKLHQKTKYSFLLKLHMPAFSVRTIQQCSIPVFLDCTFFLKRKKVSPLLQRKKMFDLRMVSHESK